ncbi:4Fe-4S dicluster domain-containing protein [Trichloromonas sp.]|uniref:NADH-quinone oxidoreductase subunit B family protein n=1 Tax=Trichloromonas sp. TaxID=3069249 RepID=UPI002A4C3AEE|nr:4Fe-4S dicluster domain-containing protein [Trichloromonas sp.]
MLKIIRERWRQGYRTGKFPKIEPVLAERFRGLPQLPTSACPENCRACQDVCPTDAITFEEGRPVIDLGRCLFCDDCARACPEKTLSLTGNYHLAASSRENLLQKTNEAPKIAALNAHMRSLFGRSLKLRQVSTGGCNACEADLNVLATLVFDLGRFGIQFVASPRHADGLLVTGPVTENMKGALLDTYAALAEPKLVIAAGACAINGGPFIGSPEIHQGIGDLIPVDLYIPGCPPHPYTSLDGMLRLLGRLK